MRHGPPVDNSIAGNLPSHSLCLVTSSLEADLRGALRTDMLTVQRLRIIAGPVADQP